MRYDVITVGGATEDITFYVDDYYLIDNNQNAAGNQLLAFDYGTKVNVRKTYMTFGGGAANTAVSFAALGLKVAGYIHYGDDDRGKRIIDNLKKKKVDIRLMQKEKGEISAFSFIVIGAKNEHVAFSHRAANSKLQLLKKDLEKLRQGKWIYITSFSGSWKRDFDNLFSLDPTVKIAWNPGEVQLNAGYKEIKDYLKRANVIILNKDEAVKLVVSHKDYKNKAYEFLVDSKNLAEVIHNWGADIVIVTNGEEGAYAYNGEKHFFQKALPVNDKVDTTGLGDAFGSAFVAGLIRYEYNIKKSLYLAALNSASVLTEQGAQNGILKKSKIKEAMKGYKE